MKKSIALLFTLFSLLLSPLVMAQGGPLSGSPESEVLDPDKAFKVSVDAIDPTTVLVRWEVAPGHYLYRDKLKFALKEGNGVTLGTPEIAQGEEKNDEFFGRIQVFHHQAEAKLPLVRGDSSAGKVALEVRYQGCAEAGICYPPMKKLFNIDLPSAASVVKTATKPAAPPEATPAAATVAPAATEPVVAPAPAASNEAASATEMSQQDSLAASLAGGNKALTVLTFFGLGLLLAFTPCVFPMIPILSSIIVGHGKELTTRKAFTLSLVYVLAMAITYTIAGVVAGLFGSNIQAAFQSPWILGTFSAVFVALAMSMFGFFELQLPSSLQSKITEISNKQEGGSLIGVAVMGLLSALIVGPCVAPPLMGALIYIGQTGDAVLGGLALFALSMGMGIPLIAVGTSAGKFLPRAGGWMDAVKGVFGVMLLGVAIWMMQRVLPEIVSMLLWAILLIASAIYMGALEPFRDKCSGWTKLWKGLGVSMLVYGTLLLVGIASGGRDPMEPLGHLKMASVAGGGAAQAEHLTFKRIKTEADFQREMEAAKAAGKPVMLDFYADWCVSCKEFEKYTFSNAGVRSSLANAVLLQADVTGNDDDDVALMKRFGLIGPPAILFFKNGEEQKSARVVGFMEPEQFKQQIDKAFK